MQRFVLDTITDNSKKSFFRCGFFILSLMAVNGYAQQPADTTELKPVVVKGKDAAINQSTAAKIIVTQDDLTRFGDTTIGDALKRVPGVSVNGVPGRGGEIRMRGLGNGYTQILLNGEPTAPGFSLDSIAPNLIERIEVIRTATADQSAQAIAGTINIILKKEVKRLQRSVKLAVASERDQPAFNIDAQQADKKDAISYSVASNFKSQKTLNTGAIDQHIVDTSSAATTIREKDLTERNEAYTASITPRVSWALNPYDNLVTDGFISYQRGHYSALEEPDFIFDQQPLYGENLFQQDFYTAIARAGVALTRQLSNEATLETKLGINANRRQFHNGKDAVLPYESLDDDIPSLERKVSSLATDEGFTLNGKYRVPFRETHAVALGWDGESSRREEDRIQRDLVATAVAPENLDEDYSAQVYRLAFFAQDEWDISKQWSAYTGLRWEGLHINRAALSRRRQHTDHARRRRQS